MKIKEGIAYLKKENKYFKVKEEEVLLLYIDEFFRRLKTRVCGDMVSGSCVEGVQKEMLPWIERVAEGAGFSGKIICQKCVELDKNVVWPDLYMEKKYTKKEEEEV
jgi:hypothetical protein